MSHQPFATGLQATVLNQHSNVIWEGLLTTKFGPWIDTRSSTDNTFHDSGGKVEKSGILLQIEKTAERSDCDLTCYVFSLEDALAYWAVRNASGILAIEK